MVERRLHFNKYGVLTAKLTVKKPEEDLLCPEFISEHERSVSEYFENEYSAYADLSYRAFEGKRRYFRPHALTVSYSSAGKGSKYIKAEISSQKNNGEKAVFTAYHRVFSYLEHIYYGGESKRKSFAKTI